MHPLVREMGAGFLMLSPQAPEVTAGTKRRNGLTYDILSDSWARVAGEFGIAYEITGDYRDFVQGKFGLDVGKYNGTLNWRVPVSATYVIDRDRRIELAHVEPDHRVRLEPEETLVALARLRDRGASR
jgi:peroxiredoxin